MLLPLADLA